MFVRRFSGACLWQRGVMAICSVVGMRERAYVVGYWLVGCLVLCVPDGLLAGWLVGLLAFSLFCRSSLRDSRVACLWACFLACLF